MSVLFVTINAEQIADDWQLLSFLGLMGDKSINSADVRQRGILNLQEAGNAVFLKNMSYIPHMLQLQLEPTFVTLASHLFLHFVSRYHYHCQCQQLARSPKTGKINIT